MASGYRTHTDIFMQADSLNQTLTLMNTAGEALRQFYARVRPSAIVFVGCGSSYSTSLSVAAAMQRRLGIPVHTIHGGDLLRHPDIYATVLRGALLITLSRSGSTSETLYSVRRAKEQFGVSVLSIDCAPGSPLNQLADYAISLPWAREDAVCQTRAVSNLYLAGMLTTAIWSGDASLADDLADAVASVGPFMEARPWAPWADKAWRRVVTLGDGELFGAAQEGGLVMLEMAGVDATTYSTLDVRHGPVVLLDESSLVILFASAEGNAWEPDLVADLRKRGATVLVVAAADGDGSGAVTFGRPWSDAAFGLLAGMVPQALAYHLAVLKGVNPDQPQDLTPWIDLSQK